MGDTIRYKSPVAVIISMSVAGGDRMSTPHWLNGSSKPILSGIFLFSCKDFSRRDPAMAG